ncbi:MAG: MBL fold metallo-hydrolase [Verrucomicrobiales bacterium]
MELEIFQSDKGDCLLLSGKDGGRVLCDGGMKNAMMRHLRPRLGQLAEDGERIDAVYVSHIDQDHISGVLRLLEDVLEWKIYDHHHSKPEGSTVRKPDFPRPPEIGGIWHNAFRDLITKNRGRIEELLAASAPVLFGTGISEAAHLAHEMQNIASSIPEALKVSRLVKPDLLDIPLNRPPGRPAPGELLLIEEPNDPFQIGSLNFQLIGPSKKQLRDLRKGWNNWLRDSDNRAAILKIRREMWDRVNEFASGSLTESPFDLRKWNGIPDFDGVTIPNTASLMFLVEEEGHTLLLTGDSHQKMIIDGLRETGNLVDDEHIHVDVLKVPHHGSEHNVDEDFCRRVSADHYVFCGDGKNGNPEPEVIQMYHDSRLGSASVRAMSPAAQNRNFTYWFSTVSSEQPNASARRNLEETESLTDQLVQNSNGRMRVERNQRDWITLRLSEGGGVV